MSSDSEEELCVITIWQTVFGDSRSYWVHPFNEVRSEENTLIEFIKEMRRYEDKFKNYTRMTPRTFDFLLNLIEHRIKKKDTNYRKAVTPEEKLFVTLRYLATGESFKSLHYHFRLGERTISGIIYEVSQAIWDLGGPIFLKTPSNDKLLEVADKFERLWNFPNCFGAIDRKHVRIQCPSGAGSEYFNYKKFYSIVLQAVADADGKFSFIDVGDYGRNSDGGVFKNSTFGKKLIQGFDLPRKELPFVFVGDEAYPLKGNLMRPYPRRNLTPEKRVFNYRLSRARRVVECVFGILTKKFGFLKTELLLPPDKVVMLTSAACVLHNMLREKEGNISEIHCALESGDILEPSLSEAADPTASSTGHVIRQRYLQYFNSERGSVPWQDKYAYNI